MFSSMLYAIIMFFFFSLLGFLFHSVCSDDTSQSAVPASKDAVSVSPAPTGVSPAASAAVTKPTVDAQPKMGGATAAPTADDSSKKNTGTNTPQAPTPTQPTAVTTTPAIAVIAASNPVVNPDPKQPQAQPVTNNPAALLTSISGGTSTVARHATPAAATPSPAKIATTVATADSSRSLVVSPYAATISTPAASLLGTTAGTVAPASLPGTAAPDVTTKIPKVATDALTTGQQTAVHTTSTSKTSQEVGNGGQFPCQSPG